MSQQSENVTPDNCTHDCSTCGANCASRDPASLLEKTAAGTNIKHVIAVMSGKGGVGKSMVSSEIAIGLREKGFSVGILDADITGPSIPKAFGVHINDISVQNELLVPAVSEGGIKLMSLNLLIDDESSPVAWRGPIIAGTVKQFWTDVMWGELDYLVIDMPPGTGDVPLTVFQSIPVDGIVVVTSPQELVGLIVEKAVRLAGSMQKKILGIVENMSYVVCPHCGEVLRIFGESHVEEIADHYGLEVLGQIPMDGSLAAAVDRGAVEKLSTTYFEGLVDRITELMP